MENLRVVLVATRNPLNMGAVARAIGNFGAGGLRVVRPYEKAFREARSAVGAAAVLRQAEECATVEEAVADCGLVVGTTAIGNREIKHPLRSLDKTGVVIRKRLTKERVAILFGSEKKGLSNEDLSYCHWLLHIPTRGEHQSMNLGQAAAVCLWELARGARSFERGSEEGARGEDGDGGADYEIFVGEFVAERVCGGAEREIGGGEAAADGEKVCVGRGGWGSVFGDGEEDGGIREGVKEVREEAGRSKRDSFRERRGIGWRSLLRGLRCRPDGAAIQEDSGVSVKAGRRLGWATWGWGVGVRWRGEFGPENWEDG